MTAEGPSPDEHAVGSDPQDQAPGFAPPDALTLATVAELEKAPEQRTWVKSALLLGISIALFAATGIFNNSPGSIALIIGILFFHELGHYLGMRLFNYQDVRMFFIPFFGAAVSGRSRSVMGYQEAIVLLLGPLPGIALGIALAVVCWFYDHSLLRNAALLLLVINAFNLLPLMPLDGGRLLRLVIFSRQPLLEAFFHAATGALLAWFGWATSSWITMGLGALMVFGSRNTYRVSRLAKLLRGPLLAGTEMDLTAQIPREQVIPLVELARKHFPTLQHPNLLANTVRQVWERIHLRPPGLLASLFFLFIATVGFLSAPVVAIAISMKPVTRVTEHVDANGSVKLVREVSVFGRLQASTELDENRQPHGQFMAYYHGTDTVQIEGAYDHGQREGKWTYYTPDGQIESVEHYRRGQLVVPAPDDPPT